jgi:hypothetical protein
MVKKIKAIVKKEISKDEETHKVSFQSVGIVNTGVLVITHCLAAMTQGVGSQQRIGDKIRLTGIRIQYRMNGALASTNNFILLRMVLVKNWTSFDIATLMYRGRNNNQDIPYSNQVVGDELSTMLTTLNTGKRQFEVVMMKTWKISGSASGPIPSAAAGVLYKRLNQRVDWTTSQPQTPSNPAVIRPSYEILMYAAGLDNVPATGIEFSCEGYCYYKDA